VSADVTNASIANFTLSSAGQLLFHRRRLRLPTCLALTSKFYPNSID
jgi:hypothetical protein